MSNTQEDNLRDILYDLGVRSVGCEFIGSIDRDLEYPVMDEDGMTIFLIIQELYERL